LGDFIGDDRMGAIPALSATGSQTKIGLHLLERLPAKTNPVFDFPIRNVVANTYNHCGDLG
tara:strand:+ start:266 stop:448 length:183 start_codon:yes stop_codon:yes gene_type:complete